MVRAFQGATMRLKTSTVPVVAAPAGLALGGGCEVCLHVSRSRVAETTWAWSRPAWDCFLAGGGTKEMLLRAIDRAGTAIIPFIQTVFETIGFGKVSTSAPDAKRLSLSRDADAITMNRARLLETPNATHWPGLGRLSAHRATKCRTVGGPDVFATLTPASTWRIAPADHRSREDHRRQSRTRAFRRRRAASHVRRRAGAARSRTRGLPQPLRRAQDNGTNGLYAEDWKTLRN